MRPSTVGMGDDDSGLTAHEAVSTAGTRGGFTSQVQPLGMKHGCHAKLCSELLQLPRGLKGKAQHVLPTLVPLPCHPRGHRAQAVSFGRSQTSCINLAAVHLACSTP